MDSTTKRLDLRFGAFACSVQGFDDPVMPVQQILRAIQHLLEESPEISDAGISFDAETIESLTEEVARRADVNMSDLEICPGLVIVYHGEGAPPELERAARPAASAGVSAAAEDKGSAVVFGKFSDRGDAGEDAGGDPFSDRLRRSLADGEDGAPAAGGDGRQDRPRDVFAPPDDDEGGDVFGEPRPAADREPNIFAKPAAGDAGGDAGNDAGGEAGDDAGDDAPAGGGFNLFGNFRSGADYEVDLPPLDEPFTEDAPPAAETEEDEEPLALGEPEAPKQDENDPRTLSGLCKAAGAATVPDMIVGAAAFMVLLKGQTSFSRRDVLETFDLIPGDHEKTLEARIKGFGRAVRNGQIMAVEDGLFGLSAEEVDRFQKLL